MDINKQLAQELEVLPGQVNNTVALIDEGNTIPFIARYRKEVTGGLDDAVLRKLHERLLYLRNLEQRKEDVIRIIGEQDKLTDELTKKINNAMTLQEVEDIYRPYKPKRRTRATIAKERGLEPLATLLFAQQLQSGNVDDLVQPYLDAEKEVHTMQDALNGAKDIIAEIIADNADYRKTIRALALKSGNIVTKASDPKEDSVYRQYDDFSEQIARIANHRVLAIDRGEKEKYLSVKVIIDSEVACLGICKEVLSDSITTSYVKEAIYDAYDRLIWPSIEREVRSVLTERAQESAIELFAKNLQQLLLQPPVQGLTILALDPGYRTGCKMAVIDPYGKVLDTGVVYCTLDHHDKEKSKKVVLADIAKYNVDLIVIGNGTASRETELFAADVISEANREVKYLIVSEAGASVYSASELASKEFPQYDVALRSAVSIARRVEDPLAELVKIDPKAIGVGQYQHDMNQKHLGEALGGVVEHCVNSVGIDVNTASPQLLSYVAGISAAVAKNIVDKRETDGRFTQRTQLKKVGKLGPKAFLQCAGFLRIVDGKNILDNTAVHPESYELATEILHSCGYTLEDVKNNNLQDIKQKTKSVDLKQTAEKHGVGMPTINDILDELLKPGRDPRDTLPKPILQSGVVSIESLSAGMVLKGTVRNITDFGAFVDIGVHQDGLVHISQIADKFIKHPMDILSVGDIVHVKIVDIDVKRGRISLSMRDIDHSLCNFDN